MQWLCKMIWSWSAFPTSATIIESELPSNVEFEFLLPRDLVSYNQKRNRANGHNNTDGPSENHSWNCGWEGDDKVPRDILKLRKQQIKNFCCLLFLSNGTPMFRAGDEFMQTQGGNNNPYNQDNETVYRSVESIIRIGRDAGNESISSDKLIVLGEIYGSGTTFRFESRLVALAKCACVCRICRDSSFFRLGRT
jgi:hypothetical protein